jgi:hypothetical protein
LTPGGGEKDTKNSKPKKGATNKKLHKRNLGPVRPSVGPSSRRRRRSPARHVKLQTKRKNTTIHAKHKPKAPSQWSPRPNPRVSDEDSGDCKRQKDATTKSSKNKGLKREKKRTTTTRKKREEVRKGVERDGNWWRAGGPAAVHEHKHQLRSKLGFTGKTSSSMNPRSAGQ